MNTTSSTTVRPYDATFAVVVPAAGRYAAGQPVTRRRRGLGGVGSPVATNPSFATLDATGVRIGGMTDDVKALGSAPPRGRYW